MAMDTIRKFYDHLITIEETDRSKISLDLFIVSNGGDGTVPWRLVTLFKNIAVNFLFLFLIKLLVQLR